MLLWVINLGFAAGSVSVPTQGGFVSLSAFWSGGAGGFVVAPSATGNIIFGHTYNMIHTIHENPMRPTDATTELTVRKRDKKPIIIGGDF